MEYKNRDDQWHHIYLIKDEDPHTITNYIITNDVETIIIMTHGRWTHLFLRSLKITLRPLRHSDFLDFDVTTFNPFLNLQEATVPPSNSK